MFRNYELFRAFGIPIRVHGSLLVFLPILAFLVSGAFLPSLLFVIALFGCVVLHELGHSVAALYYKIPVKAITLYPIGGVAGLASMPKNPKQELVITIAGPAVNFVLAVIFFILYAIAEKFSVELALDFLFKLSVLNVFLGVFNLLPGFPMDGGRILRALLATRLPYLKATRIAVTVGQVTAGLLALGALTLFQPMMLAIAIFIFFAARAELRATEMRERHGGAAFSFDGFGTPSSSPPPGGGLRPGQTFVLSDHAGRGDPNASAARSFVIEILPDGTVRSRVNRRD